MKFMNVMLFDRYVKDPNDKMVAYTHEFEKLYHKIKQKNIILPKAILAFELLDSSGLDIQDRQLPWQMLTIQLLTLCLNK